MNVCESCYQVYKDRIVNGSTLCDKCKAQDYKYYIAKGDLWVVMDSKENKE